AVASRDFGRAPALLRTLGQFPLPRALVASGRCRPGDVFVLGTDAISQRLLRRVDDGRPVASARLWAVPAGDWVAEVEAERDVRGIVNDDCTLVLVRVDDVAP